MTGYPIAPLFLSDEKEHRRQLAQFLNNTIAGHLNAVTNVTLTPSATTTTVTDARIGPNTHMSFTPLTANAATARAALYVSARSKGSATLTHANSANADQTFSVLLIG
jgi:hypothetical protein